MADTSPSSSEGLSRGPGASVVLLFLILFLATISLIGLAGACNTLVSAL